MSGGLTGAAQLAALDYIMGRALDLGTAPQTMQLALLTAPPPTDPSPGDLTEVISTGYARQTVSWAAATESTPGQPSSITTSANVLFGPFTATGGLGFPATHCALLGSTIPSNTSNLLSANAQDIETDATAWTAALNATLSQSAAQAKTGTHSLAVASTAAGDTQASLTSQVSATPYVTYSASGWAYSTAAGGTCKMEIVFYDSSATIIQRIGAPSTSLPANTWTQFTVSAQAPPNTVTASPFLHSAPTGAGTTTFWDSMSFAATQQQTVLATWQFDTPGTAAQNESLQISAHSLVMTLG